MNFDTMCRERFEKLSTVLCIGLDPVIEKIPVKKDTVYDTLTFFLCEIIENFHTYALAVKPNIAFYEQYGIEGLRALETVIKKAKEYDLPVILDAKRGDIGNTSLAYAKALFDQFSADAITLAPYMGEDSVSPFFQYKEKGFFILARTSNPGSRDFQLLEVDGTPLYQLVTGKIAEWNKKYGCAIGAVAGATHLEEMDNIVAYFSQQGTPPLLIPGVGKQGGSFSDVIKTLEKYEYPKHKVFINSSSKILYAYQDHPDISYLEASKIEVEKMKL